MTAGHHQQEKEDDESLSESLLEQFVGFYVLSVLAVKLLETARAHREAAERAELARQKPHEPSKA